MLMTPDDLTRKIEEIDRRVEAIHSAIVGGLDGKPGLVQRVADLDARVARLEATQGWVRTLLGGAVAALVSAWALVWGGPHGK
jgi:hypothetical protein